MVAVLPRFAANVRKECVVCASDGVVGVEGSEGVRVNACLISSSIISSTTSAIVASGLGECLSFRSGDSAPGAVFDRFNGLGRCTVDMCDICADGLGECVRSAGNNRRTGPGDGSGVSVLRLGGRGRSRVLTL